MKMQRCAFKTCLQGRREGREKATGSAGLARGQQTFSVKGTTESTFRVCGVSDLSPSSQRMQCKSPCR